MATATSTKPPLKAIRHPAHPLALWHLLSLDAPTIAALWTWFIASANHIHLPLSSTLAMALAVWMLYAADRLMDARLIDARLMDARLANIDPTHHEDLEARHYFHHRHRTAFLTGILLASIALALLLPHLEPAAIRLYLILGGLVFGYFIVIHARQDSHRYPKELAVGICFAAATFIPTIARQPTLRPALLPPAILFAALCSLNCLFIYAWEHAPQPHHLPLLAIILSLTAATVAFVDHQAPWTISAAVALAAALLLVLHRLNRNIPATTLRATADLVLLTPALLLPFLK